ncbi:Protein mak11 [Microbotryomycetes sp. JL221]|nr:Protein mak11 [Microbotryomycetes sp. JL221]
MAKRKAIIETSNGSQKGETSSTAIKRARFASSAKDTKAPTSRTQTRTAAAAAAPPKQSPTGSKRVKQVSAAPSTFVVSAGSYERLLYGLKCEWTSTSTKASKSKLTIEPYFAFPAHLSSLKTVAASMMVSPDTGSERKVGGKYLVSGGTDEIIKVWDLKRRREVGTLEGDATGEL